jgi:dimethylargininase
MTSRFTRGITRLPGESFSAGITTAGLGAPHLPRALEQHAAYCKALAQCGMQVTVLDADERFPDSTFVEDTAVVTPQTAVITRPGADSRKGETEAIHTALSTHYAGIPTIEAPGTVDGGDICQAGDHFFIGVSARTNPEGARQLAAHLQDAGFTTSEMDIRGMGGLLHLKSGMSYLGNGTMLIDPVLADQPDFEDYRVLTVTEDERYAANCIRVNDFVLFAASYPQAAAMLSAEGFDLLLLDMSEFRKMDGGLSCLSLRF